MLNQLFPERFDNTFRGYRIALVLFALVVLVRIAIGLGSIFNGYQAASGADGIPLATFPAPASQTIVSLFALIGLSRLMLGLLCVLALIRYRSMIPLLFVVLLLEQIGRQLALRSLPIPRTGEPPVTTIHLVLLGMMIVGLALSLIPRDRARVPVVP